MKVTIYINEEKHILEISEDQKILEAMIEAGIDAPYSCESGICGTCRGKLTSGAVDMETKEALTDEESAEGYILTCQACPKSDCSIHITDF